MPEEKKSIKELVDEVLADGKITREEHKKLREAFMADGEIDQSEHEQLQRIMDLVDAGKVKIIDEREVG